MQALTSPVNSVDEGIVAGSPMEALLEASGDVTLHLNDKGLATFTSRSAQQWGGNGVFVVGVSFFDLFEANSKIQVQKVFDEVIDEGKQAQFSFPLRAGVEKSLTWKLCRYVVGAKRGVLAVAHDITERQELELQVQQAQHFDALTGLPNRGHALELCEQVQSAASAIKSNCYFMLINVSGLTRINNAMGSKVGDNVLVEFVQRLTNSTQEQGRAIRMGSTEFGVFLNSPLPKEDLIRKARHMVALLDAPYYSGEGSLHVKVRAGVTAAAVEGSSFDELFAAAAKALTQAKNFSQVAYLDVDKGGIPESKEFMRLEAALHEGVSNGELYLVYQPLHNGTSVYGVEALMRWKQASGPHIIPAHFIPVAEANGLIQLLGEWALKFATVEVARKNKELGLNLQVSVNVSPVQFLNPGFARSVNSALAASGLSPELLQLEITEGTLMEAPEMVEQLLKVLSAKGVKIAVDDFGTGYSSLAYLKRFALNTLKIDRSFVKDLPGNEADLAVCSAISELSRKLNLSLVAEGIETQEQLDILKQACKCSGYQGYLFGKPARLNELQLT